ncbi:MAG TPA: hypothetical protein VIJ82_16370 [Streptosporangiaceae bacterium]|jgi:hypothetical protein
MAARSHSGRENERACIKSARRYRPIEIRAGPHVITAAGPLPDDLRHALDAINGTR